MSKITRLLLIGIVVLARFDEHRRQCQQEMDGGSPRFGDPVALGRPSELSQYRVAKSRAISRAPAEWRLGDRSLPSQWFGALALLAAQARGRTSSKILHRRPRLRPRAGRLSRGRRRSAEMQQGRNPVLDDGTRNPALDDETRPAARQQRARPLARRSGFWRTRRRGPRAEG